MNIDALVARVEKMIGHTDFRREPFTGSEHTFKRDLSTRTQKLLGREALNQLIAQEKWADVCQRVTEVFKHRYGLARWDEYQWVRYLDAQEQRQFALALNRFLHGEGPFPGQLERFVDEVTDVYNQFQARDTEQQKHYARTTLTWPFVSYFHFMLWPDREYVFIKPSYLRDAAEAADFDIHYRSAPNPETYASVQEFYRALWPTVQSMGGRDWIDVQSFIHIAGGGYGVPKGGWTGEREPDLWDLQIARWRAEHLPPERIAARREAEQEARKLLEDNLGHLDGETLERFLELLNADFYDGKPGYTRFGQAFRGANRKLIVEHLDQFNAWSTRLWREHEPDLYDLLDEFWQQKALPGAGRSLPTMILYLRDPSRYNIWIPTLKGGLERLTDSVTNWERSGAAYRQYNDAVNQVRTRYGLQPQEIDVILTLAYGQRPPRESPQPPLHPPLAPILTHVNDSPYIFSQEIITNYHLSLLTKPFVILTGLSGTGKTKLTRLYADAVYGIQDGENNPYYAIVAVRPDWTDNRGLLGYYNPLTRTYEATPFLRFMLQAATDPENWYYLCLDEMNLARVEYYFSDFLSAMESKDPIALHGQQGCVATQAGEDIVGTLPIADMSWGYVVDDVLYVPPSLHIPPNLALSGTVNVDETTHAFSDKVLDRANSIEFNQTDLDRYEQRYRERFSERAELVDEALPLLRRVYNLLEPRYLHFGYRTLEEVLGYLWQNETLPDDVRCERNKVLDNQLMQKVLPKLRGDERIRETLRDLRDLLSNELGTKSRSADKLKWMLDELDAFGSTQFWR
jgi:hypothetical protein